MRIAHILKSMSRVGGAQTNTVRDLTDHQSRIPGNEVAVFAIEDAFCADDAAIWGEHPVSATVLEEIVVLFDIWIIAWPSPNLRG